MIVLDTHAWVWWATSSPSLSKKGARAIDTARTVHVSAISVWEVAMLAAKGRLVFDRDLEAWVDLALRLPGVELVPLSPRIAVRSARLEKGFLGDPADRIIVATALEYGCAIVSKDKRMRGSPLVRVIW